MLFNSLEFVLFLIAVVVVYYLIPNNRIRKVFLLVSSYYFYSCWNVAFLTILLFETFLSYTVARCFKEERGSRKDKGLLIGTIILLLLPLLVFKYLNFFCGSIGDLLSLSGIMMVVPEFKWLLPIGISFYTFMSIGYVVDVYQKKIHVEKNLLDYALFIGFFPQIASGPIGRAQMMLPQFKEKHPFF